MPGCRFVDSTCFRRFSCEHKRSWSQSVRKRSATLHRREITGPLTTEVNLSVAFAASNKVGDQCYRILMSFIRRIKRALRARAFADRFTRFSDFPLARSQNEREREREPTCSAGAAIKISYETKSLHKEEEAQQPFTAIRRNERSRRSSRVKSSRVEPSRVESAFRSRPFDIGIPGGDLVATGESVRRRTGRPRSLATPLAHLKALYPLGLSSRP